MLKVICKHPSKSSPFTLIPSPTSCWIILQLFAGYRYEFIMELYSSSKLSFLLFGDEICFVSEYSKLLLFISSKWELLSDFVGVLNISRLFSVVEAISNSS
jgi:hypothetical protein